MTLESQGRLKWLAMGQAHLEDKEGMMQPGSDFTTEEIEILFAGSLFTRGRWSLQVNGQKVPHENTVLGL